MAYPVINTDHTKNSGGLRPARPKTYPNLGQTPLKKPSSDLTEEQIYKLAGQTIVTSGEKLAAKMSATYDKYQSVGSTWLAEAAGAFLIGGPVGPFYTAADLWWQGDRNNEAVAALQASQSLGTQWMNEMTQEETGWLQLYLNGIEKVDPALAKQVDATFNKVNTTFSKTAKLLQGVKALPPQAVNQFISTFFSNVKNDMVAAYSMLSDLAAILRNLLAAMANLTHSAKTWSDFAPGAALAVIIGGVAVFALHS